MQTRSASVYRQASPMKYPLFRMLWCDSVAPLGNPVVPLVYWMLMGSSNCSPAMRSRSASSVTEAAPGEELVPAGGAEQDDLLQRRQIGPDLVDHRLVVAGLERLGGDQHPAARLVEDVRQLRGPVGRVDVDQDHARPWRWRTGPAPIRRCSGSRSRPVARLEPEGQQPPGDLVDRGVELGVGVAPVLVPGHEGEVVGHPGRRALQVLPDRLAEQRLGRRTVGVRQRHEQLTPVPPRPQ